MKALFKKILFIQILTLAFVTSTTASNSGEKTTTTFKVYGQCGECKERIENGLQIKGITFAEWNEDTKELTVTYNPKKITLDEIHKKVNEIGYDTDKYKATDEANGKLPKCCQRGGH